MVIDKVNGDCKLGMAKLSMAKLSLITLGMAKLSHHAGITRHFQQKELMDE